jgi:UDP-N-acetylglucosamine 2-epimerase (non-hydrolysing)
MYISIILGTRPEIIKMSPIIRDCQRRNLGVFILHTGQHYSYNMDKIFFDQLELPVPKYNLGVGSSSHSEQIGKMLIGIEKILQKEKPDIILVQGDTNTVLAGAIAASKLGIKIGHVEAGLRSYDPTMPEEINRILTDHCSNLLFAPTKKSLDTLLKEGISHDKIFITGNTIVDAVQQNSIIADKRKNVLTNLKLKAKKYFLVTAHRQENVDSKTRFEQIITGLNRISDEYNLPIIYPIHPRSRKMMNEFNIDIGNITLIEPLDFLDFLQLETNAKLVLTDSGGVQEEACILNTPCITLRDNTERPETIDVGSNLLAGANPDKIFNCTKAMLSDNKKWDNPFGDGRSGEHILDILEKKL